MAKTHDKGGRKSRFYTGRFNLDHGLVVTPRDTLALDFLGIHGTLNTLSLWHLIGEKRGSYKWFSRHWKNFKDWIPPGYRGPLIYKAGEQFDTLRPETRYLIWGITHEGQRFRSTFRPVYQPSRTDHMKHRFMNGHVNAAVQYGAERDGHRYICFDDMLAHENVPEAARDEPKLSLKLGENRYVRPDHVDGIEYQGDEVQYQFFATETDRNTESIQASQAQRQSWQRKFEGYFEVWDRRLYYHQWGIPNFKLRVVTNNVTHMQGIMRLYDELTKPKYRHLVLFKAVPYFEGNNHSPDRMLTELWDEPWLTVDGHHSISRV